MAEEAKTISRSEALSKLQDIYRAKVKMEAEVKQAEAQILKWEGAILILRELHEFTPEELTFPIEKPKEAKPSTEEKKKA